MSTESIFRQTGRLIDSYTGIGPGKTRDEYLRIFSRASYSTQNEWPYASPFAGFYDIANTSTSLILLNQRYKQSRLRGQVLPRTSVHPPEDDYQTLYKAILEAEQEPKPKKSHNIILPRVPVDPDRHFESMLSIIIRSCLLLVFAFFSSFLLRYIIQGQNKYWHNRMCKGLNSLDIKTDSRNSSEINMNMQARRPRTAGSHYIKRNRSLSNGRRAQSAFTTRDRLIGECQTDPKFVESLWAYYWYLIDKSERTKIGLQQFRMKEPSSKILRQSGLYRNPALTRGQKLYLLQKCHVYDSQSSKLRHANSYAQVLSNRFQADLPAYKLDLLCKPEYRLNDPKDYFSYSKFLKTPRSTIRPINMGYFTSKKPHVPRIPDEYRNEKADAPRSNDVDKKNYAIKSMSSFGSKKSSNININDPSRRLSASSFSVDHANLAMLRLREESKKIPKVPISSSKPQN